MSDVLPRLTTALADRYRVERELGMGGMATVYLAHDLKHERDVALKVLHPELAAVLGAERFLAEIKTTAKLQHPHILPLLDSGDAGGLLFYVMPVVDGESLRQRLQRDTQLPVDDAIRITKEVGSALDYAHRHGVIHRDIKPENILLHDNSALVTDFGIALAVTAAGGARLTQTGLSLGTPQYMAPEQAMGEKAVDARADIYALGCVLYEMLAGQPPFTGPTAQAIVAQVLTTDAAPVTTHRRTTPPAVSRAVHAAMQKLPADRFASVAEFAAALDGATDSAALWTAATAAAGAGPMTSRPRTLGIVVAAVAVGTAIGSWAFGGRAGAGSAEPRFYQIALPDSAPFVAGVNRYDASLSSLALSRDGRTLAYVAGTPTGRQLALVRLDRGTVTVLRGTDGAYLPAFSPDGRYVAFATGTKLQRISIDDGTVTTLTTVDYPFGVVWGTDGRIYMAGLETPGAGCIAAMPEAGGAPRSIVTTRCLSRSIAAADPDARRLISTNLAEVQLIVDTRDGSTVSMSTDDGRSVPGTGPLALGTDRLILFRDSSLYAAAFDFGTGRMQGNPVSILTNVRREAWTGTAHLVISAEGTLVWVPGGDASIADFVWLDPTGRPAGIALAASAVVGSYALSPDETRIAYSTVDPAGRPHLLIADLRRKVTDEVPSDQLLNPANWIRNGTALTAMLERPGVARVPVLVDLSGSVPRVDTTQAFEDESRDGGMRCFAHRGSLTLQRGSGPPESVDALGGGWCRFSADGARIVWTRGDGLFVARTSGRVMDSRVQIAPAGADEGRWSEDGRRIYYRFANEWFVVNAPTADMRPDGEPRLVFAGSYLQAWASWERARGGRFLMLRGAPPARVRDLNVMTNFPTLVEAKLRVGK